MSQRDVATKKVAEQTAQDAQTIPVTQQIKQSYHKSLDKVKDNIQKTINESKNQIPQYTNIVNNYQEKALESTRKISEDYIEAKKSVISSIFDSALPYYENVQKMYNYWFFPRIPTEIWTRSVSNVAETIFLATRIGNDFLYGSIEAIGRAFDRVKQYTEELSRINVHNAETIKVLG